ncbi:right-handed parallel beta-helix repeat-containing protein [Haloarcula amylovorans]|uniref:right-handed parallel beta-helix repeat-containing protein n=1 Tax=Haloarcula amylovorans TaxID=2562280 RepID=UPI00142F72E1|nr:right-handed parallel beta-helix repeat-containing protein [Halomicroarcula amylolytica]
MSAILIISFSAAGIVFGTTTATADHDRLIIDNDDSSPAPDSDTLEPGQEYTFEFLLDYRLDQGETGTITLYLPHAGGKVFEKEVTGTGEFEELTVTASETVPEDRMGKSFGVSATLTNSDGDMVAADDESYSVRASGALPEITEVSPTGDNTIVVTQGESQRFSVTATDADNDDLTYEWRLKSLNTNEAETVGSGSSHTQTFDVPIEDGSTAYQMIVEVSDSQQSVSHEWLIDVQKQDEGRAPTVTRVSPSSSEFSPTANELVEFTAEATDPDADLDRIEWYVGDSKEQTRYFGSSQTQTDTWNHTVTSEASQQVTARVYDDDGNTAEVMWSPSDTAGSNGGSETSGTENSDSENKTESVSADDVPLEDISVTVVAVNGNETQGGVFQTTAGQVNRVALNLTTSEGIPVTGLAPTLEPVYFDGTLTTVSQDKGAYILETTDEPDLAGPTAYQAYRLSFESGDGDQLIQIPIDDDSDPLRAPVRGLASYGASFDVMVDGDRYTAIRMEHYSANGDSSDVAGWAIFDNEGRLVEDQETVRKAAKTAHVSLKMSNEAAMEEFLSTEYPNRLRELLGWSYALDIAIKTRDTSAEMLGTITAAYATGGGSAVTIGNAQVSKMSTKEAMKTAAQTIARSVLEQMKQQFKNELRQEINHDVFGVYRKSMKAAAHAELQESVVQSERAGRLLREHDDGTIWTYEQANATYTAYSESMIDGILWSEVRVQTMPRGTPEGQLKEIGLNFAEGATGAPVTDFADLMSSGEMGDGYTTALEKTAKYRQTFNQSQQEINEVSPEIQQKLRESPNGNSALEGTKELPKSATIELVSAPEGSFAAGEEVEAVVEVTNTGSSAARFFVGYSVGTERNGQTIYYDNDDTTGHWVSVPAGESKQTTVTWTVQEDVPTEQRYDVVTAVWEGVPISTTERFDDAREADAFTVVDGTSIEVVDTQLPQQTTVGTAVPIEVTVENTGSRTGSAPIYINQSGEQINGAIVEVADGESRTITVYHQFNTTGTQRVSISGTQFTIDVTERETSETTQAESETTPAESTPTDDEETATQQQTASPDEETDGFTPPFTEEFADGLNGWIIGLPSGTGPRVTKGEGTWSEKHGGSVKLSVDGGPNHIGVYREVDALSEGTEIIAEYESPNLDGQPGSPRILLHLPESDDTIGLDSDPGRGEHDGILRGTVPRDLPQGTQLEIRLGVWPGEITVYVTNVTAHSPSGETAENVTPPTEATNDSTAATESNPPTESGQITSCTRITESGRYELTGELENRDAGTCLQVSASDAIIDGNGHRIEGTGNESAKGVWIVPAESANSDGISNVTIQNIQLTNWGTGVEIGQRGDNTAATLTDITVSNNDVGVGLFEAGDSSIANVTAVENEQGMVLTETGDVEIRESTVARNTQGGLYLTQGSDGNLLTTLTVKNNSGPGISIGDPTPDTRLLDSRIANNSGFGIEITGNSFNTNISNVVVKNNNNSGLRVDDTASDTRVVDSEFIGNGYGDTVSEEGDGHGIELHGDFDSTVLRGLTLERNSQMGLAINESDDTQLVDTVVGGNGGDGIRSYGSVETISIERTNVAGNGNTGIRLSAGTNGFDMRDSSVRGNDGTGIRLGDGDARLQNISFYRNEDGDVYDSNAAGTTTAQNLQMGNWTASVTSPTLRMVGRYAGSPDEGDLLVDESLHVSSLGEEATVSVSVALPENVNTETAVLHQDGQLVPETEIENGQLSASIAESGTLTLVSASDDGAGTDDNESVGPPPRPPSTEDETQSEPETPDNGSEESEQSGAEQSNSGAESAPSDDTSSSEDESKTFEIISTSADATLTYEFVVDGSVAGAEADGNSADIDDGSEWADSITEENGRMVVTGRTGNNEGDVFTIEGSIESFTRITGESDIRLEVDNNDVTDQFIDENTAGGSSDDEQQPPAGDNESSGDEETNDATAPNSDALETDGESTFEIISTSADATMTYRLVVDGSVSGSEADGNSADIDDGSEWADSITEEDGRIVVTGRTGNNEGDVFTVDGRIHSFKRTAGESDFRLELDNEDITDRLGNES